MGSPRNEFDLLLEAPDPIEAEMARTLLASAGIPCLIHGQDRDFAELGCAGHRTIARPDLFVPRGLGERARALLQEAWDERSLSDEIALSFPRESEPGPRSASRRLAWFLFGACLALAVVFAWLRELRLSSP